MAASTENILIFGGTGVIGKFITGALLDAKSSFGRIAIFTSAATVSDKASLLGEWKAKGLEVIVGDLTKDHDVLEAYKGFDTIVSAVGRNVIASQINLLELAEQTESVKRFFPSEYGTDIEYWPESAHEKPHQQKLKVRRYIAEHVKRLEICYLVTGPYADLYMGAVKKPEIGTYDVKGKRAVLLGDGNGKISLTTMADVGKLLVGALQHPEAARNRALKVNSFTTTPAEILAEFEKQTGEKWQVSYTSLPELKKLEQEAWDKEDPMATGYTLRRIWTEGGTLYSQRDNEDIGVERTDTLESMVSELIKKSG